MTFFFCETPEPSVTSDRAQYIVQRNMPNRIACVAHVGCYILDKCSYSCFRVMVLRLLLLNFIPPFIHDADPLTHYRLRL